MKNKGFTLVEVIAVIIIMGVLGSLLMLSYSEITNNAKNKTRLESAKGIIKSAEDYVASNSVGEGECINIKELKFENHGKLDDGKVCVINNNIFLRHVKIDKVYISGFSDTLEIYNKDEKIIIYLNANDICNKDQHNDPTRCPLENLPSKVYIEEKGVTPSIILDGKDNPWEEYSAPVGYNFNIIGWTDQIDTDYGFRND